MPGATTLKESLKSFLQTIGINDKTTDSLFNDDGTELSIDASKILLQHDATRVAKFKADVATAEKTAREAAIAEGAGSFDVALKAKYKIDSDKTGDELIDEIIAAKANVTLDDDKVKLSKPYIQLENELRKQIKETEKTWQGKFDDREKQITKDNTMKSVLAKARAIMTELKPILPSDPAKAEKQMQLLVQELSKYEYVDVDGNYSIVENGKPKEDDHGVKVSFENLVKSQVETIWDLENGTQKSTPAASNDVLIGGKKVTIKTPKTEEEYMKAVQNPNISKEERLAISDAYETHVASQKTGD